MANPERLRRGKRKRPRAGAAPGPAGRFSRRRRERQIDLLHSAGRERGFAGARGTTGLRYLCEWTSYQFVLELFRCPIGDPKITSARVDDLPVPFALNLAFSGEVQLVDLHVGRQTSNSKLLLIVIAHKYLGCAGCEVWRSRTECL